MGPITRSRSLATAHSELNNTLGKAVGRLSMVESAQHDIADKLSELLKAVERSIKASEQNKETLTEAHELGTRKHTDLIKSQQEQQGNASSWHLCKPKTRKSIAVPDMIQITWLSWFETNSVDKPVMKRIIKVVLRLEKPLFNVDTVRVVSICKVRLSTALLAFKLKQIKQVNVRNAYLKRYVLDPFIVEAAAEKKFYITQNPNQPEKLSISEDSGYCGFFPNWYFITAVVPSPIFPQTVYVYSINDFLILNTERNDTLYGELLRYFYVANDKLFNQSQAVYTVLRDGDGFAYVTEFLPRPILNSTNYGFFVKEFASIEGGHIRMTSLSG
ncbi:Hypothetical predicted protein [Paramuricea clavata]|uniref:Uncharacterized protein n=1 Tax=Paramuricea clavata TaxID=317549 RepID=A0A6S7L7N3_PARCT|nr:Hypothetical predicted protein [Paramuricea clavata]